MNARRLTAILLMLLFLAACGGDKPAPEGDPPILSGLESLPKQIATIALTETATPVIAGADSVVVAQPTSTAGPPRPTATLTPYVGIFLGAPTLDGSEDTTPAPTLAPYVINPASGGPVINNGGGFSSPGGNGGTCSVPVADRFADAYNANTTVQQQLGCPVGGGTSTTLVAQPFERGSMYWRETRQIYALANNGQFWQVTDSWQEGMPADDPGLVPPGGLLQPVRGFGLAWRNNQAIRDALGWSTQLETPYNSTWQDFERGALFVGQDNRVYAIFTAEGQHSGPLSS
jgi:hypothetical protein